MYPQPTYRITEPTSDCMQVQAWSSYPLQFGGQRKYPWQDQMAVELRSALVRLTVSGTSVIAGDYLSTDPARCDVENQLFTNLGTSCFPAAVQSIRFERGTGPPPPVPAPITAVGRHLYYYRYHSRADWQWWQPDTILARWHRITRSLPDDGSARPVWLAMKLAIATGEIDPVGPALPAGTPFGIRITVHAAPRGPHRVATISESVIDGTIAAFHQAPGAPEAVTVAAALARKIPSMTAADLEALVTKNPPTPLFPRHPFIVRGPYIQISPDDEHCIAGQVTITHDTSSQHSQLSGEIFTLRPATPSNTSPTSS
ncbi:MAG TPA: hypothetical protein VFQ44_12130 [Streptosporangiaceae bacterium]|nr:hypothetical protein [Streptosporangiaceae bacterium]